MWKWIRAWIEDKYDLFFSRWKDGYSLKLILDNTDGVEHPGVYACQVFVHVGEFLEKPTGAELVLAAAHALNYDQFRYSRIRFWDLDPSPIKLNEYDMAHIPDLTHEELLVCPIQEVRSLALNGKESVAANHLLFGYRYT